MESYYDPRNGDVVIAPNASLYTRFHELAHKDQHESGALCFRIWLWACNIPFARYFVSLWVEFDAHGRARRVMERLGVWSEEACQVGKKNLMSYIIKKEIQ